MAGGGHIYRNLLTQYGEITLAHVKANAIADYIGKQNRLAQVSQQVFQSLQASVEKLVTERLVTETAKDYIDEVPDGPSYLMVIIQTYFIHTFATPTQVCLKIAAAPDLIQEKRCNVDEFNT